MSILILAEHDNAVLNAATLNSVTAALEIGGDIDLLVAGKDCGTVADQAAEVANVRKVLYADENAYQFGLAENIALLVAEQSAEYSHILATATTSAKNIMPRVAALLDMQAISDISAVVSDDTFERPIYAGSMIATVKSKDAKKIVTVRGTAFDAAATSGGSGQIMSIESDHDTQNSRFVGEEVAESDRPELAAAGTVVSGGRALGSEENFSMIYSLADALGAAVGASRAAVDAGYAPNDMQVGQTGKIVAPDLYVAVGISGAIQHLAGMKDSKVIVAINKDEEAPIFSVSDYGLADDLFKVIPDMEKKIN